MLILIEGYIIFDQGYNEQFLYTTGFSCSISNTITTTVTFSGTFQVPPQILLIPKSISMKNQSPRTFDYDIISLTTQQFQIKITCPSDVMVKYLFNWYAVNDNRIVILEKKKQTSCLDQSIYTHSHNLSKAKQAFVILQSWGMSALNLDFYIEVYEITSTSVKIKLHNSNSNLLQIGYQIVIGTQEAFVQSSLIASPGGQNVLLTKSIPKLNLGFLFPSLAGFSWSNIGNIRMQFSQQSILENIEYTCETFDVTQMNTIRFNELWVFQEILTPMYVYSYRITKKYDKYISDPIKIMLIELNQEYTNIGDFQVSIPNALKTVIIQIELKFQPGEKLIGTFLKCFDCGSQNVYRIEQNYLCGNNFIRYRLLFKQQSNFDQTLQISIGISEIKIKQIINQSVQQYQIAQLKFVEVNP
ncbi:unnamed protein product [Paramecium pentaurelia]|uniref:H-type lectin domain-containing protein n=1 Tax=Paramecium pentaurelia TaxID=43138 RepID=A0A8S1UFL1_9CILI|nr:unnamed protein product [Paramecium pentaurelia]